MRRSILLLLAVHCASSWTPHRIWSSSKELPVRGAMKVTSEGTSDSSGDNAVEARMQKAGITLPPAGTPKANYNLASRDGNLLYLSGHLPMKLDGSLITGVLGEGLSVDEGYEAARWAALNLVSTMKAELGGDLSRVEKVIKLFGIVQSDSSFHAQHLVLNGASDAMNDIFGKTIGGSHARSAIGTNSLPLEIAVEVEAIVRVLN